MTVLSALCALAAGAAGLLLAVLTYLWLNRPRCNIPGPRALPLIGNVLFFRKHPIVANHFKGLQRLYGNVYKMYLGPVLSVYVTDSDDAQKILGRSKPRTRGPYIRRPLHPFLGDGLINSSGESWRTHRKIIEQCFHSELLKQFTESFDESARHLCGQLAESAGREVQLYEPLCLLAMRSIATSAFGLPFEEMEPDPSKREEIASAFLGAIKLVQVMLFKPWMQLLGMINMLGHKEASVVAKLVKRAIAYKKATKTTVETQKRSALMDTLLKSEVQMTDEEIFDEIRTFLGAGTETTATALGYALTLLALYPKWQYAAQKELDDVFGTGDDYLRPCTFDDLARLQIIDSIIKETLRLFPTSPAVLSYLSEDTPLAGGRYVAPRGSYVAVALFLLHRQPHLFPEPETFNPGRFMSDEDCIKHPYSYLPFGAGPRRCVGSRFAIIEMKTVLASVLRRFSVLPGSSREDLENVMVSVSSQPVSGFRVTCVHRENIPSCGTK